LEENNQIMELDLEEKDLKKIIKTIPNNFRIVATIPFRLHGNIGIYVIKYKINSEIHSGFIFHKNKGFKRFNYELKDQQSIHEYNDYFMIIEPSISNMKSIKEIKNYLSECELKDINDRWVGIYKDGVHIGSVMHSFLVRLN